MDKGARNIKVGWLLNPKRDSNQIIYCCLISTVCILVSSGNIMFASVKYRDPKFQLIFTTEPKRQVKNKRKSKKSVLMKIQRRMN